MKINYLKHFLRVLIIFKSASFFATRCCVFSVKRGILAILIKEQENFMFTETDAGGVVPLVGS